MQSTHPWHIFISLTACKTPSLKVGDQQAVKLELILQKLRLQCGQSWDCDQRPGLRPTTSEVLESSWLE